jgi:two-component system, LytTR family, response regulator
MRVLIADDERVARDGLRQLLSGFPDVDVVAEAASGTDTVRLLESTDVDLVLLDINMPGMTGLEVVASVGVDIMPMVVFVTAYEQHAVNAFDLHALDYLVKPFSEARFHDTITRARRALRDQATGALRDKLTAWLRGHDQASDEAPGGKRPVTRLRVEQEGRIRFVAVRDIRWIEAQDYCVLLHLEGERILRRGTLKRTLEELDARIFVRVHRSAAVNVRHVRDLVLTPAGGVMARMANQQEIPVAASARAALEARLAEVP